MMWRRPSSVQPGEVRISVSESSYKAIFSAFNAIFSALNYKAIFSINKVVGKAIFLLLVLVPLLAVLQMPNSSVRDLDLPKSAFASRQNRIAIADSDISKQASSAQPITSEENGPEDCSDDSKLRCITSAVMFRPLPGKIVTFVTRVSNSESKFAASTTARSDNRRSVWGSANRSGSLTSDVHEAEALSFRYERIEIISVKSWSEIPFARDDTVPLAKDSHVRVLSKSDSKLSKKELTPYVIEADVDVAIGALVGHDSLTLGLLSDHRGLKRSNIFFREAAPRAPPVGDLAPNEFVRKVYVRGKVKKVKGAGAHDSAQLRVLIVDGGPNEKEFKEYYEREFSSLYFAMATSTEVGGINGGTSEQLEHEYLEGAFGRDLSYWRNYPTAQTRRLEVLHIEAVKDPGLLTDIERRHTEYARLGIKENSLAGMLARMTPAELSAIRAADKSALFKFRIEGEEFEFPRSEIETALKGVK